MDEFYHCTDCEESQCGECSWGFYAYDEDYEEQEVDCPCCGSTDVQP